MIRADMISTVGRAYLTSNIENDEYSYPKAFSAASLTFAPIQNSAGRRFEKLDIRFVKDNISVLIETKQNFTAADEEQLSAYVEYEKALTGNKIIAILANTINDNVKVWRGVISDGDLMSKETALRTMDEYVDFYTSKINDKEKVMQNTYKVNELFEVKYGINMELNTCIEAEDGDPDAINFVARTESNNGVSARVKPVEGKEPQPAGLITCAGGGSVLSTFLQEEPFYSGRDLYLLIPLQPMSKLVKLFCITVLKANKYRYSYGRQANITLPYLELMLPANADGTPDFNSMDSYMKSLPYGDRI